MTISNKLPPAILLKIKRAADEEAEAEAARINGGTDADGIAAPLFSDEYLALVFASRHQNDTRFVATALGRWVTWQQPGANHGQPRDDPPPRAARAGRRHRADAHHLGRRPR